MALAMSLVTCVVESNNDDKKNNEKQGNLGWKFVLLPTEYNVMAL